MVQTGNEPPVGFSRGRADSAHEPQPFVLPVDDSNRLFSLRRPNPPIDRMQPNPMLILRPDFDLGVGLLRHYVGDGLRQFF